MPGSDLDDRFNWHTPVSFNRSEYEEVGRHLLLKRDDVVFYSKTNICVIVLGLQGSDLDDEYFDHFDQNYLHIYRKNKNYMSEEYL